MRATTSKEKGEGGRRDGGEREQSYQGGKTVKERRGPLVYPML
jgi:hypothetical protein